MVNIYHRVCRNVMPDFLARNKMVKGGEMNMTIAEAHEYSDGLKQIIAEKQPNHPILKKYFGSVWDEIDALEVVIKYER